MVNLGLTSVEFLTLLPIVVLVYYLIPNTFKQYYLLIINLFFYASFGYVYIVVIILEALVAWVMSVKADGVVKYVGVSLSLIAILLVFRIVPRYIDSIVAPLGVSFYTMQAISYVTDVRMGRISPEKNYVKLLFYLSFFPTVTSGPIIRYDDFIKQYDQNSIELKADYYRITNGIVYMLYGYFLKLVIAERASIPVNKVFDEYESTEYCGILLFIIAVTYSIQIYADFAGYSAIVVGLAQILGYDIQENFNAPYLSASIKEFWGRWHISLSAWLRDYIYIPLGGNRKGRIRKYINIFITFLISGIWHGFRIHFIVWGMCHALYQIVGDISKTYKKRIISFCGIIPNTVFYNITERIITFLLVTFAWVFFRTDVKSAGKYVIQMITKMDIGGMIAGNLWNLGLSPFDWILLGLCVLFLFAVDYVLYCKGIRIDEAINRQGSLAKGIYIITIVLMILILGIYGDQHDSSYFVYRDF